MRRYYQILGVSPTASPQEIKEAWLFSLKAFHPDKFAGSSSEQRAIAETRTRAINEAYKILSEPVSRSVYDRDYFRESSQQAIPPKPSGSPAPKSPPVAPEKSEGTKPSDPVIVSLVRRKPLLTSAVLGGFLTLAIVIVVLVRRPGQPKEPPFSQIVIPSTLPTPAVMPTASEKSTVAPERSTFDLPKLAAVTRKAVGLVIGYDSKGKVIQTGSGFFISEDGRFVTNEHVIHGTKRISIKMENGAFYSVSDTLADSTKFDLAILQVRAKDMPYLTLETSGIPEVGTRIAVIGSPASLEGTLSDGIVSAIRTGEGNGTWIQITAPISPGSSGSPVLNGQARVVGIVTLASKGPIQNLNFARSTFDLVLLSQGIGGSTNSTASNGLALLKDRLPSPAASPPLAAPSASSSAFTSPPPLTLTQSPTPADMLAPSPTPAPSAEPPIPASRTTYRVSGLPRSTPFLNIRAGPGANFAVVGVFTPKGRGIICGPGRTKNGETVWQEVSSGNIHGWVNAQYLEPETPAETKPRDKPSGGHN